MTLNCFKCGEEITFDYRHKSKTGKKIPLDPEDMEPHQCSADEEQKQEVGEPVFTANHKAAEVPRAVAARVEICVANSPQELEKIYNDFMVKIRSKAAKTLGSTYQTDGQVWTIAVFYEIPANAVAEIEK